jgi:molecular chaperone GrpE
MRNKHSESEEQLSGENVSEEQLQDQEQKCECNDDCNCDEWEQKYQELNDGYLRLNAEFDNYRKRTVREKADLLKSAGEGILINILPLIDDFERAMEAMEKTNDIAAVKEGVELIYNKFISFLTHNGVRVIETENQPFDLDLHEAITTIPAPSEDMKGKIVDCVSKGYTLNDKVIRFPKVVVGE